MSLSLSDWEKEAEKLTDEQKLKLISAFETIRSWPVFDQNFGWTGYNLVCNEIKRSLKK